ncbi:hypothetical protein [Roseibacillus ishigakijimensis]|uniref:Uncharacterized protein n=1 Tax=Roseibacillus ishigakijimensis TaxID=454146 RepID=A0A934RWC8_9BACT|nr:hypothetical protein [Roseibacillus ishigakijimensis]MBK1835641.1 hypothetical protein [Roseibacillus ishigakijimensis]
MKRISIKRISVIAFTVVALVLIYGLHSNRRPFKSTDDYKVTASINGETVEADVFKPVGMNDVYYVRIDGASDSRYPWIVFSPNRQTVAAPIGVYRSWIGYTYTHADQGFGVLLTDAKLEDDWTVSYDDHRIDLTNTEYQIQIARK